MNSFLDWGKSVLGYALAFWAVVFMIYLVMLAASLIMFYIKKRRERKNNV